MIFTKAVSELGIEEGSHVVEQSLFEETGTEAALAMFEGVILHCDNFGRPGHTIYYCFYKSSCAHYKKDIKYSFSGSRKPYDRIKQQRPLRNAEGSEELANVALIGVTFNKSADLKAPNYALMEALVTKEDFDITPVLRDKLMIVTACTSHIVDVSWYDLASSV